jgi:hypothetical protein
VDIKPIETRYKGYRFRSRLEARWAVFFDTLGIRWEFEPEGIKLPGGVQYLPDFLLLLPSGSIYAETKRGDVCLGDEDLRKAEACATAGRPVLVLDGTPDAKRGWNLFLGNDTLNLMEFADDRERLKHANFADYEMDENTGKFWRIAPPSSQREVIAAVDAARSARFEFGESGAG